MTRRRCNLSLMIGIGVLCLALPALSQSGDKYNIRLSSVPALRSTGAGINVTAANVAGSGAGTATLSGKKLTVNATFEKLVSPATAAHLFLGPVMGARDYSAKPMFDLMVTKAGDGKSGSISGTFDLTSEQVDALKKGRIYVQLHNEGSPTGALMGWIVK
jgi:hypothetical protein